MTTLGLTDYTPATRPASMDLGHHLAGSRAGQLAVPAAYAAPPTILAPQFKTLPFFPALSSAGLVNLPNPVHGGAPAGGIWSQLAQGFTQAGAGGLAALARAQSPDLVAWLRQESGLRPGAVSPANNHGQPNGGLFQFWEGHPWAVPYFQGGRFTMPVVQQARAAVRYFGLTPADVHRYAQEIRQGSYRGWG